MNSTEEPFLLLCCCFSPDLSSLIAGSSDGFANIVQIPHSIMPDDEDSMECVSCSRSRKSAFLLHNPQPIYCMKFADGGDQPMLLCGRDANIQGFTYSSLCQKTENKKTEPAVVFSPSTSSLRKLSSPPETNAIAWIRQTRKVVAGHGNGAVSVFDMETGKCESTLWGHAGAVYCVTVTGGSSSGGGTYPYYAYSGGEDGAVRLWDLRSGVCCRIWIPFEGEISSSLVVPEATARSGEWVGCLDVDAENNWMVCGGSRPYLTQWHLPSSTLAHVLPTQGVSHCVVLDDVQIISAGNEPYVSFWSLNGKLTSKAPTSCLAGYALASSSSTTTTLANKQKLICCAGLKGGIDFYDEWNRRIHSIN